ncbi:MAG: hypothetical protein NC420_15585 [Eubacterium sp.]|nr:hypothetical protein [Eubacterium sp.]MCM1218712.1 hypothetical protein [Lachnospiraceae bacterium]MCM1237981.1 hypothetical protein [Lachnospiraceae bacterium]
MTGTTDVMNEWKERLADVDDDYLIGISNKGIVKRAYKDKEESAAEVQSLGDEAVVKVGEETVTVCFPLGESRCSCPSRSICRHVVQAILTLRESAEGDSGCPDEPDKTESAGEKVPAQTGNLLQGGELDQTEAVSDKVRREIDAYPLPILKKTLGNRQFQRFVSQVVSEVRPQIQYASTVTVRLPVREAGAETVVRLLSPLEYSSCTCHKKELCAHKAAAILWCKLDSGKLTPEELAEEASEESSYDMDRVQDAAGQMKRFLEELLGTGLSRTSPDVLDHMERLAVISHNAGLANFEGWFRGLFDSYDRYFKRKAAFRTEDLMGQITRLYRRVRLLQQAKDNAEIKQHAGEFRAEYVPVGSLDLIGIAMEHFNSGTGYEGETIYFLEENTKKWYTYTNARPMFYEKGRKRKFTEKAQAPWGLGIAMEQLAKVRIRLTGAKCDERGRLSSSQDTRGEVVGEQRLSLSDIEGWYYRDFGKLFTEQIGKRQRAWLAGGSSREAAELVFVQPDSCEPAEFSQTGQQLSLPLYDEEEREVTVEVAYSKEEAGTIRYLERISKGEPPCFVGRLYLKDGRLRMYPVAVQNTFFEA